MKNIYKTREEAERAASDMGCAGAHFHEGSGWMPCSSHAAYEKLRKKPHRGRGVVGIETLPGGGLVSASVGTKAAKRKARSDRLAATPAPASDRIIGSSRNARRSAASSRSANKIVVDAATVEALREKVRKHNEKADANRKTSLSTLKAVYRRGAGAFSVSHRPGMTRGQWAMGRVNAFLKMLKSGRPSNVRYVNDNDLLPRDHPWRTRKKTSESKKTLNGLVKCAPHIAIDQNIKNYLELLSSEPGFSSFGVSVKALERAYQRGVASLGTKSAVGVRESAGIKRVQNFIELLRSDFPIDTSYTEDNDLLPKSHPWVTSCESVRDYVFSPSKVVGNRTRKNAY